MSASRPGVPFTVVVDTSVIIPFLEDDRVDLIAMHPARFLVPLSVRLEITYREQARRYQLATKEDVLAEATSFSDAEKNMVALLERDFNLGDGEISAIAVSLANGYDLAIRDEPAIKKALKFANGLGLGLNILRVEDILGALVVNSKLSEDDACAVLQRWKVTQDLVPVTPLSGVLERLRREAGPNRAVQPRR